MKPNEFKMMKARFHLQFYIVECNIIHIHVGAFTNNDNYNSSNILNIDKQVFGV